MEPSVPDSPDRRDEKARELVVEQEDRAAVLAADLAVELHRLRQEFRFYSAVITIVLLVDIFG